MKSAIHVFSQPNIIPSSISRASKEYRLCFTILIATLLIVTATDYAGAGNNIKKRSQDRALPLLDDSRKVEAKRFIIRLKQRHRAKPGRISRSSNRTETIARLKQEAQSNQEKVLNFLKYKARSDKANRPGNRFNRPAMLTGDGESTRSFWLSNCIAVTATPEELEQIAAHPDVQEVTENVILSIPTMNLSNSDDPATHEAPWNHRLIGLDKIAGTGLDGSGVRLGVIDTGINPQHPEIAGKIVNWAEFNFYGNKIDSKPYESHKKEHGTHVSSILAGDSLGVAPGATLTVALALPNGFGSLEQLLAAMQWILNPDNDAATDDGAQIVNMSWGMWGTSTVLREAILNMIEARVLPVCAIGNTGDITTYSPGNVPEALGVGAVDQNDFVPWFSSWGEIHWEDISLMKPDISAPGEDITVIDSLGNPLTLSGTSLASPHVAGAGALLLQHTPKLTLTQLKGFLLRSAVGLGPRDVVGSYGKSRLDVAAAISFLERYSQGFNSADVVMEYINPLNDSQPSIVSQYFSNGEGYFLEPIFFRPPGDAKTEILGLADVNGDGFSDLVARETTPLDTGEYRITYMVYQSQEVSGFTPLGIPWYSFVSSSQESHKVIGFGDVNGDKKEDMILGESVLMNIFYRWNLFAVLGGEDIDPGASPRLWSTLISHMLYHIHFGLGDVNGDNKTDLIVGQRYQYYNQPISYYSRISNGELFEVSYTYPHRIKTSFYGPLHLLAVKDVNGDGNEDLILAGDLFRPDVETPVYISLSDGRGEFTTEKRWATVPLGNGGRFEGASDMNGDGLPDLIIRTSDNSPHLDLWIYEGEDQFKQQSQWLIFKPIIPNMTIGVKGTGNIGLGDWRR
jgi:subtilisin family serine protease